MESDESLAVEPPASKRKPARSISEIIVEIVDDTIPTHLAGAHERIDELAKRIAKLEAAAAKTKGKRT